MFEYWLILCLFLFCVFCSVMLSYPPKAQGVLRVEPETDKANGYWKFRNGSSLLFESLENMLFFYWVYCLDLFSIWRCLLTVYCLLFRSISICFVVSSQFAHLIEVEYFFELRFRSRFWEDHLKAATSGMATRRTLADRCCIGEMGIDPSCTPWGHKGAVHSSSLRNLSCELTVL